MACTMTACGYTHAEEHMALLILEASVLQMKGTMQEARPQAQEHHLCFVCNPPSTEGNSHTLVCAD